MMLRTILLVMLTEVKHLKKATVHRRGRPQNSQSILGCS